MRLRPPRLEGACEYQASFPATRALNRKGEPFLIPAHVAIIMDGNGRWAEARGKARIYGHKAGTATAKKITLAARDMGIKFLTLYAFSTENWKRPKAEVAGIFRVMEDFFQQELADLASHGVQIHMIGSDSGLPTSIVELSDESQRITEHGGAMVVNIALNYGGRWDLMNCMRGIARDARSGLLGPEDIDEDFVSSRLATAGQPDPDLLIRTGGESRVSNFLLWQIAYTEIVVTPRLWPDFEPEDLANAISDYESRRRRFGGLNQQPR